MKIEDLLDNKPKERIWFHYASRFHPLVWERIKLEKARLSRRFNMKVSTNSAIQYLVMKGSKK